MVFGFDDAVCCGAFAGDVAREERRISEGKGSEGIGEGKGGRQDCERKRGTYRSTSSPLSFSILRAYGKCASKIGECVLVGKEFWS